MRGQAGLRKRQSYLVFFSYLMLYCIIDDTSLDLRYFKCVTKVYNASQDKINTIIQETQVKDHLTSEYNDIHHCMQHEVQCLHFSECPENGTLWTMLDLDDKVDINSGISQLRVSEQDFSLCGSQSSLKNQINYTRNFMFVLVTKLLCNSRTANKELKNFFIQCIFTDSRRIRPCFVVEHLFFSIALVILLTLQKGNTMTSTMCLLFHKF